jgi:hypothetical protein
MILKKNIHLIRSDFLDCQVFMYGCLFYLDQTSPLSEKMSHKKEDYILPVDFERKWRLFQKRFMRIKFDIYVYTIIENYLHMKI